MSRRRLAVSGVALFAFAGTAVAQDADLQQMQEEHRRMREQLEAQQRQIEDLQKQLGGSMPASSQSALQDAVEKYLASRESGGASFSGWTKAKSKFSLYGFLRLDAFHDDQRPNNTQLPGWILSEDDDADFPVGDGGDSSDDFTMHPRLTRLGLDFDGGEIEKLWGAKVAGKFEVDFYGGGSESRAGLRMRHAYVTLKRDDWQLLAGQTGDLIAPLNPVVNNDLVMWGAGNLGDRRPQVRLEYDPKLDCGQLFFQTMAGLTGAIDAKDLDGNTFRDGESSGHPTFQARAAFRMPFFEKGNFELGVWGHWADDDPDTAVFGESSFESRAYGADVVIPLLDDQVWVKAEYFKGENLTDVRGGIFQGVNSTTGEEIESQGGFVELGFKATGTTSVYVGYSVDDPSNGDLSSAARAKNDIKYVALRFDLAPVEIGVEYLHWRTEYIDLDEGVNDRVGAFISYKF